LIALKNIAGGAAENRPSSGAREAMAKQYGEMIKDVDAYAIQLKGVIPDTISAFTQLSRAAQAPGALDRKTKELIALSIAVSGRCDACIGYHARGAGRAGATRQEVAEALGVAIQMGGGPSVNYAADALRAFDQLSPAPAIESGAARA
jgi:AhpD family alkylhydroperoxidase